MRLVRFSTMLFLTRNVFKYKVLTTTILFLFSAEAYSVDSTSSQKINPSAVDNSYLLQLFIGLFVVVFCIVVLAWAAKKMRGFQSLADDSIKIISAMSMGARERILLLQVGEEQILIGVAPGKINKLHVLDKPVVIVEKNPVGSTGKMFSDKLKTLMSDASYTSEKKNK